MKYMVIGFTHQLSKKYYKHTLAKSEFHRSKHSLTSPCVWNQNGLDIGFLDKRNNQSKRILNAGQDVLALFQQTTKLGSHSRNLYSSLEGEQGSANGISIFILFLSGMMPTRWPAGPHQILFCLQSNCNLFKTLQKVSLHPEVLSQWRLLKKSIFTQQKNTQQLDI